MKIPIIVLNYNSSADCRECIADLKRQEGVELEIVIVDNCSPREGERDAIKQLCIDEVCTFIQAFENRGYNAGNNIGLRYAADKGYKYALIANPDMRFPQKDYVAKMTKVMEEKPEVAVCGSDIVNPEGWHQNPMKGDGDWKSSFGWITVLFKSRRTGTYDFVDNYSESHYCSKVSGCCLMVRMVCMQQIDFFDEGVFLFCEEAILAKQVERVRQRMYYTTVVQAVHAHKQSEKGDPIARFRFWKQSRFHYIDYYSTDNLWGRIISKFTMAAYANIMITYLRLKR